MNVVIAIILDVVIVAAIWTVVSIIVGLLFGRFVKAGKGDDARP